MEDKIEKHIIETYCFISNLDSSVLLLNDWLKTKGFEFIEIDLFLFQNNFGQLIYYKHNTQPLQLINTEVGLIDGDFFHSFNSSLFYEIKDIKKTPSVILLKRIDSYELHIINGRMQNPNGWGLINSFVDPFLRKLRILKSGSISSVYTFEIEKGSRHILVRMHGRAGRTRFIMPEDKWSITSDSLSQIIEVLNTEIEMKSLNEIAILNFESSYTIDNLKIRFITLVASLESIFNYTGKNISQTISQHLSTILSSSKNEFNENYNKIKAIYKKRSNIVHGSDETLTKLEVLELENLVRFAILYTIRSKCVTSKELFTFLSIEKKMLAIVS